MVSTTCEGDWALLDASSSTTNPISIRNHNHTKEYILDIMIRSPEHIHQKLSDEITVIDKCDFPDQWPTLLYTTVRQFQQPATQNSFQSISEVLKNAHSLFDRYHHCRMFEDGEILKIVCEQVFFIEFISSRLELNFCF
jgi:hypothetical protein